MKKLIFMLLAVLAVFSGCNRDDTYRQVLKDPESYQRVVKHLSDVIVYDIFSPPVASRIYAYCNIAAYEVLAQANPDTLQSLGGQIADFTSPPPPSEGVNQYLASIHAFLKVSQALIFSEEKILTFSFEWEKDLVENGLPDDVREKSLAYGDLIAKHVLDWADKDMYKQTRTYPKYTVNSEPFDWKPTPPDYMEGIEPHWSKIRTLILDSANQFIPPPPLKLSMDSTSEFYGQLMEVYREGGGKEGESRRIAKFWDCNPYVSHHRGHAMFATKKITPGGHWVGIVSIASRKAGNDFAEVVEAHTRTSIALFDGFISCWDEKWRSIVIRPETLINQYIDEEWTPLLQTPPFPEYTSGHSVISRAAAIALTDIYGDDFSFEDTTEMEYGLPERKFKSFLQASEEAAISRLYGGIHYRMAIDNGVIQGEEVGKYVVKKLRTRKIKHLATN